MIHNFHDCSGGGHSHSDERHETNEEKSMNFGLFSCHQERFHERHLYTEFFTKH